MANLRDKRMCSSHPAMFHVYTAFFSRTQGQELESARWLCVPGGWTPSPDSLQPPVAVKAGKRGGWGGVEKKKVELGGPLGRWAFPQPPVELDSVHCQQPSVAHRHLCSVRRAVSPEVGMRAGGDGVRVHSRVGAGVEN
eukprot:scaffold299944_cov23-Tisochrysis_lutea.AAC.1